MTVQDVIHQLDDLSPMAYAEDFDNVGLLVGVRDMTVKGILVTLDTLEAVVDEAIQKNCNLIVSFHPIIFSGLKKITGSTYVERVVMKAIKHEIAIFAIHTALDNAIKGVNDMMCEQLGLVNRKILMPKAETIKRLTTYVPTSEADALRKALFDAGGGEIGNYSNCSFNIIGKGTFKGNESSQPTLGEKGSMHEEEEVKLTMTYAKHLESRILKALFQNHSYEEVAYEITTLDNSNQTIGMGMVGEFNSDFAENEFLEFVKDTFKSPIIKHSRLLNRSIHKVAVLGGSGSFAIQAAKSASADAFITADLKYHDFFKAEGEILLMDIGHFESEQYTKSLIAANLKEKIPNFAIILSETNTNPVKYF